MDKLIKKAEEYSCFIDQLLKGLTNEEAESLGKLIHSQELVLFSELPPFENGGILSARVDKDNYGK